MSNFLWANGQASARDEPDDAPKLSKHLQYRHGTSLKDRAHTLLDDVLLLLPTLLLVCFLASGWPWYHSERLYKEGYFHVQDLHRRK